VAPWTRSISAFFPPSYLTAVRYSLVWLLFCFWFFQKVITGKKICWPEKWFIYMVCFWLSLLLFTTGHSVNLKLSLLIMIPYLNGFILVFIFVDFLSDQEEWRWLLDYVIWIGTFVSILAIVQYLIVQFGVLSFLEGWLIPPSHRGITFIDLANGRSQYRASGTFYHPNNLGVYLGLLVPLASALGIEPRNSGKRRILYGISVLCMLFALYCSGSRGGILTSTLGLMILGIFTYRSTFINIIAIALVLSLLAFSFSELRTPVLEYFRLAGGLSGRPEIWQKSFQLFLEHPFLGSGVGTLPERYLGHFGFLVTSDLYTLENEVYQVVLNAGEIVQANYSAHNLYINSAVEMGFLAPLSYLCFIWLYLRGLLKAKGKTIIIYGIIGSASAHFAHTIMEGYVMFTNDTTTIMFALLIALGFYFLKKGKINAEAAAV
jgi:O-antigen ligase